MIKLFVAGNSTYIERIRQAAEQTPVQVVFIASDPSTAIDLLERHVKECHAVLLGFDDERNKTLIEIGFRHNASFIPFISTNDLINGYKIWTPYKARPVLNGQEIEVIKNHLKDIPVSAPRTFERTINETEVSARVEAVRERSKGDVEARQRIISLFSFKGGVGKTAISVALGLSMAALTDLNTVIIDLDTTREMGDVVKYLGFIGEKKSLVRQNAIIWKEFPYDRKADWEQVQNYLLKAKPRLYVLPGVKNLADNNFLTPDLIKNITDVLSRHFDLILFDLGNHLTDQAITAMELSNELFLVDTLDLPEIDSLKDFLDNTVPHLELPRSQISIIFNRIIPGLKHDEEDASYHIGTPCIAAIPEDIEVRKMLGNDSQVPFLGGIDIPFTRELEKVLLKIYPRQVFNLEQQKPKSGISKWLNNLIKGA